MNHQYFRWISAKHTYHQCTIDLHLVCTFNKYFNHYWSIFRRGVTYLPCELYWRHKLYKVCHCYLVFYGGYLLKHIFISTLGLYSLSGKTSYHKISWSLEAARFGFKLFQSLWNLAGTSAALLPRCLSNFRAIRPLQHPISRLRDFTRFGGKTSYRLVNRGPVSCHQVQASNILSKNGKSI